MILLLYMPSSGRFNKRRKEKGQPKKDYRTFRPKLKDFKRRTADEGERQEPRSYSRRYMSRRRRPHERSLQARHMNNIFEDFRSNIESMLNPWSLPYWESLPSTNRLGIEGHEGLIRRPLYDIVDNGDKYELQVELPGIERDKIRVNATDESIEISAEQSEEEKAERQKKNYVYDQRSYSSFYCAIPTPEEILSSEVTAKMNNNGILRVEIPKKMPTKPEEARGRSITVE
jgi:HSP20 family protein